MIPGMINVQKIEEHVSGILTELQFSFAYDEGLRRTPIRVASMLADFSQNHIDLKTPLRSQFDIDDIQYDSARRGATRPMIVQQRIPVGALCEHHLLPFIGWAAVGYIPKERVVGLSKIARLVHAACHRRPTIQERLTDDIVDALFEGLDCHGAIVLIEAEHTCMSIRGAETPGVKTTTSALRGLFYTDPTAKSEFLSIIYNGR